METIRKTFKKRNRDQKFFWPLNKQPILMKMDTLKIKISYLNIFQNMVLYSKWASFKKERSRLCNKRNL